MAPVKVVQESRGFKITPVAEFAGVSGVTMVPLAVVKVCTLLYVPQLLVTQARTFQ